MLVVRGVYDGSNFDPLLGALTVSMRLFDRVFVIPSDVQVFVDAHRSGPAGKAALASLLADFPAAEVRTLDEFIAGSDSSIGMRCSTSSTYCSRSPSSSACSGS